MARVLAAVVAVTLASIATQAAAQVEYTTCNLSLGGSPVALATGDFDDNGNPDLAVVDQARNQVIILLTDPLAFQMLNCGNPGTRADVAVGTSPVAIAAGDLDNNLTIDLAVATQSGISILTSNASGVFTAQAPIPGGPDPQAIAIADVTGDARADIIIGNGAENRVIVLRGAASNPFDFNQRFELTTGAPISFLVAEDLNLDSEPDIAAGSSLSGQVITFIHEVATTFRTLPALNVGVAPRAMVAVDLTRDAVPDLAVVGGGVDGRLSTYRSQLPGNELQPFVAVPPTLDTGRLPSSVAAGNINGNFDPDLVVSNQDDDTVQFFFGDGNGGVSPMPGNCNIGGEICIVGTAPQSVVLADIDADGSLDVITANQGDSTVAGSLTFLLSSRPNTPTPIPSQSPITPGTPTASKTHTPTATNTPSPTNTGSPTVSPTLTPTVSNCFIPHATPPGCDMQACQDCVCAPPPEGDPFCCNSAPDGLWDATCVAAALGRCAAMCPPPPTVPTPEPPTVTASPTRTLKPTATASNTHTNTSRTPTPSVTPTGPTPTESQTRTITPTETSTPTRQPTATPQCFGQGASQICTSGDTCALTPNPEHSAGALFLLLPGLLALAVRRGR